MRILSPTDRDIIEGLRGMQGAKLNFYLPMVGKVQKFTGYKYLLPDRKLYFAFLLQNIIYICVPIKMALLFLAYL